MPFPTRAAWLALALFLGARVFFLVFPSAFIAYPELLRESTFYSIDQQCAMREPEPQIVIQGTSRLMPVQFVPIETNRWHTQDKVLNLSDLGNTFWHMAALMRRHPHLLDHADLQVIDLIPFQLTINSSFTEADALFLRESTLTEKWLVRDPARRLRAFADVIVPAWSQRHTAANWYRALSEWPRTESERLDLIRRVPSYKFNDLQRITDQLNQYPNDPDKQRVVIAEALYSEGAPSEIQVHALAELIKNRPPHGYLLFTRPPFRADFDRIVRERPALVESERRLHDLAIASAGDRTLVRWYETPEELSLVDQDYTGDGAHFTPSGIAALQLYFAQIYRELYPLTH